MTSWDKALIPFWPWSAQERTDPGEGIGRCWGLSFLFQRIFSTPLGKMPSRILPPLVPLAGEINKSHTLQYYFFPCKIEYYVLLTIKAWRWVLPSGNLWDLEDADAEYCRPLETTPTVSSSFPHFHRPHTMVSHLKTEGSSRFLRHCEEWVSEMISLTENPTVVRDNSRMEIHDSPQGSWSRRSTEAEEGRYANVKSVLLCQKRLRS